MKRFDNVTQLIKYYEGLRLQVYTCPGGEQTIGYGHVIKSTDKIGDTISEHKANVLLQEDMKDVKTSILYTLPDKGASLKESQLDALISFVFNLGIGNCRNSTLYEYLTEGDHLRASCEFTKWVNANGEPLLGLIRRRISEASLFAKDL